MILDKQFLIFAALAMVVVGALFYAFFYNSITSANKTAERMKNLRADPKTKAKVQSKKMDEKQRRKLREETLKTVDAQRQQDRDAAKPPLPVRLTQAGLSLSVRTFYTISIVSGLFVGVIMLLILRVPWYMALGGMVVFGFGFPQWVVNFLRKRRFKKFTLALPGAIDVIVRGIRSGLPLNDCIRIIAKDADEPVRSEFQKVIESTQVGLTIPEACQRLYQNIPTSEANFFAIVISIQASAGGNLSEALGNLTNVLRERKKMSDKIQAVSMEAKSSGAIVGALPFAVSIMIAIASPGYLDPLFETTTGHKILIVSALMYITGIGVMKKMINFKF